MQRKMRGVTASVLGVSLLLPGCVVGPDYVPPTAPVADAWRDADQSGFSDESSSHKDWWKVFDDPILDGLIQTAYENNRKRPAHDRAVCCRAERAEPSCAPWLTAFPDAPPRARSGPRGTHRFWHSRSGAA